jgi:tRNA (guanine6-N2)-methyltransferase
VRVCATIAPGLEPVVRAEAERVGLSPVDDELDNAGWTAFEADGTAGLLAALGRLRTVHRLGVVLAADQLDPADPWPGLGALVEAIDAERWFGEGPFAVRGHRTGEHEFTSMDLAAHVGDVLHDHLQAELGTRPAVDLEEPDAILRVHLDDAGHTRLWLDLAGQAGLQRRGYRAYDHPAGMKASLAAGLLELADYRAEDPFADPTAGGGTLVTEAVGRALGLSPMRLRGDELLAWHAPALADHRKDLGQPEAFVDREQAPAFVLGDHAPNHVEGAQRNLEAAGVADLVDTYAGDASELVDHVDEAELVVANPPYGIRSGEGSLTDTYRDLIDAGIASLADDGRIGLLTPKADLVHRIADERGLTVAEDETVKLGRLSIHLLVVDRG